MTTYYRTRKGNKAHAVANCANQRRSIHTGSILEIAAAELAGWSGCQHCCSAEQIAELAAAGTAAPAAAKCANYGVTNPRAMYSTCRSCGKQGKVNRSTGTIRAHAAAS